jgi:hypothetical protein
MKNQTKLFAAILASSLAIAPAIHAAPSNPLVQKFDFGTEKSMIFPGFTQVTNKNLSDANSPFGFVKTAPQAYEEMRPNPLEGDFVYSKGKSTFRVTLSNGQYKAWFLYGNSRYGQRVLVPLPMKYQIDINGKNAVDDGIKNWQDFYTEKYFFRGYSYIYHNDDDFYTKYVAPNFQQKTASFEVTDGHADFTLTDIPLCAMEIYPVSDATQAEDDIAYLQKELRRYTLISEQKHTPDNPAPAYSAQDQKQGYVTYSRFPSDPPFANDRPLPEEINSAPSAFLAQNQKANLSVSILPLQDLKNAKVTVSDLSDKSSGAKIAATDIDIQYIAQQEVTADGARASSPAYTYQVKPIFIKPFPANFDLMDKGINRTILLTVNADSNTKPGIYEGALNITPQNAPAKKVLLKVRVLPIKLPPLPIPAGRYAMDSVYYYNYYWSRTITDDSFRDYVWMRQKQNMQWAKDMGLTSIAFSDDMRGDILADPMRFKDDSRFVRWMDLYRDMGFQAMPWYGFQSLSSSSSNMQNLGKDRFSPEWTAKYRELIAKVRDLGKERNWPEVLFYLSDELSNDGAEGAADGLKRIAASDGIPGIRRISSVNGPYEHVLIGKEEILMPNMAFPITPEILQRMKDTHTTLWLYNVGDLRYTWGYYPFLVDAKGRFQWFNSTGNCYPFDDFDSDYGDTVYSAFVAGPNGPVSLVKALDMRDGLDDFRYLTLLKDLMNKATNRNSAAYKAAQNVIAKIDAQDVDLRNSGTGKLDAQAAGFNPSAKIWSPQTCERIRWEVAQAIMGLQQG